MNDKERMPAADPSDPETVEGRRRAMDLCRDLNATRDRDRELRRRIASELFGSGGESVVIEPPFYCAYGSNILLGKRVYFNFNCLVFDAGRVTIGDFTLIGPAVQFHTAAHSTSTGGRREWGVVRPVEIGSDVWVGGGAILCPGIRIGSRSVIGAGSVVTADIPGGVLAVGNPCRVIREIPG